jgi:hypothetical protein
MALASRGLTIAGVYGLVVLLPLYALEAWIGVDDPPPITHPEFYYGFVGVAAAWQVAFLLIGRSGAAPADDAPADPREARVRARRRRPLPGGRVTGMPLATGLVDLLWAGAFAAARARTPAARGTP